MNNLTYSYQTFVGRRDNNQDSCIAAKIKDNVVFLAVADGMGGVTGGKIASNIVIQNSIELLKEEFSEPCEPTTLKSILKKVFLSAQNDIRERITIEPVLSGMGTTLTAMLIFNDNYVWGNLGDSRIYRLYSGQLTQITEDHTYIEDYKKENPGDVPEYIIEQYSHYLTKSLDGGSDCPDIFPSETDYAKLEHNEIFLLCSDGLITNKVESDTNSLKNYIIGNSSIKKTGRNLIADAFYNGSKDNISVVLAENGKYPREAVSIKNYFYPPSDKAINKFLDSSAFFVSGSIVIVILILLYIFSII